MANKQGNQYEEQICSAIEYIVENAVKSADYDKTIEAVILSCADKATGQYRVQYQDAIFFAYSTNVDTIYSNGAAVYVLVPGNNFNNHKTILGTVANLGIDYNDTVENTEDAFEIIGSNIITNNTSLDLCSFEREEELLLYKKDEINKISFNEQIADLYIKDSNTEQFIIGATVKTSIPKDQRLKGNYGVAFEIAYKNAADENSPILKTYIVDVNRILGNPYDVVTPQRFYGTFEFDKENYLYVNKIYSFCYDFSIQEPGHEDDIFLSNFEFEAARRLSDYELGSNALILITEKGSYFLEDEIATAKKPIKAQIKVKGRNINVQSNTIAQYYWFRENNKVTIDHPSYNIYGGRGWECLNDFNPINTETGTKEWIPDKYIYEVDRQVTRAYQVTYKCVVVYNDVILQKEIVFTDYKNKNLKVTIESSNGVQFYGGRGYTDLECHVTQNGAYEYVWTMIDNTGMFYSLPVSKSVNDEDLKNYNDLKSHYETLKKQVEEHEVILGEPFERQLQEMEEELKTYDYVERIYTNHIDRLQIMNIYKFTTYKCSVYDLASGIYIGTGSITLNNTIEDDKTNLVITNGSQTYKYNEQGQKPNVVPPVLGFEIYDAKGEKVSIDIASKCETRWIVPKENTMLRIRQTADFENKQSKVYVNFYSLNYEIEDLYRDSYKQNDITLQVLLNGVWLTATTNFNFTKEGENGTNGTDYVLEIVPNNSSLEPRYPSIIEDKNGNKNINIKDMPDTRNWFKARLWKDGVVAYAGVGGNSEYSVEWSLLGTRTDTHSFTITSGGICSTNGCSFNETNVDIVQCKLTYLVEGVKQNLYATLPINYVKEYFDATVNLVENTGYRFVTYGDDGRNPRYDNTFPFELKVTEPTTYQGQEYEGDITNYEVSGVQVLSYDWNYIGNFELEKNYDLDNNPISFIPLDIYETELTNHGIFCIIRDKRKSNDVLATIYIPIHLMLNRYGHGFINEWNGNGVEIDKEGSGVILAPQAGFGKKEEDNSYTGVLIGKTQNYVSDNIRGTREDIGLLGYSHGERTIFLNAKNGASYFGKSGAAQIIVDPAAEKALLYNGDFWKEYGEDGLPKRYTDNNYAGKGMLIDLTTPQILWGNGNFEVNDKGHLVAKGGGSIAGWEISDNALTSKSKNLTLRSYYEVDDGLGNKATVYKGEIFSNKHDDLSSSTKGFYLSEDGLSIGKTFKVDNTGTVKIGTGAVDGRSGKHWTIDGVKDADGESSISYGQRGKANSVYIGTDAITLGSNFEVSNTGYLTAKSGYFGNSSGNGWNIGTNGIYNGKSSFEIDNNNGAYIGTDGIALGNKFSVNRQGNLIAHDATFHNGTFTGKVTSDTGKIGGWNLASNSLYNDAGTVHLYSSGQLTGPNWTIDSNGNATFTNIKITNGGYVATRGDLINFGSKFRVASDGTLYASSGNFTGNVSGSTISGSTMSGNTITGGAINVTTADGGYLRAGTNTNHPEVSALNCNGAILIRGIALDRGDFPGGYGFRFNDNIYSAGSIVSNENFWCRADGHTYYGQSPNAFYICTGINESGNGFTGHTYTSVWRQVTFIGGILVGITTPSNGITWQTA